MRFSELIPNVVEYFPEMMESFLQTLTIVGWSFFFSVLLGLPIGILLVATRDELLFPSKLFYNSLSSIIDFFRATPTLILITAITPFTKFVVGTRIGVKGAIVPLVVAIIPFLARQIETALLKNDRGIIEAARSMGTSTWGIIFRVILPESLSGIVNACTITCISLINFSAIAGAVGGGGLGDFALRYGYQQFKGDIMWVTVAILVLFVIIVQTIGKIIVKKLQH